MLKSFISGLPLKNNEAVKGSMIRENIAQLIKKDCPLFNEESYIATGELNNYRSLYLKQLVQQEKDELAQVELEVLKAIKTNGFWKFNLFKTTISTTSHNT